MKKRVAPLEKKKLAYERDHYVTGGESRRAYRKNWPKKKAMLNQKHRHRAAQTLHELEKPGDCESIEDSRIEVTAEQLRKVDPREKPSKFGVKSLREYVEKSQEERESRALWRSHKRDLITARCTELIATLERNPASPKAQAFLRQVAAGGGWGWDFHLFLSWNPEWRPRLEKAWLAVTRALEKAAMNRHKKETEKQRTKTLLSAIQKQTKVRSALFLLCMLTMFVRHQKGASHGQPRQARSREEKGKENGNQAIEHTGKTKARIQTYLATTTAAAIPNR